MLSLQRTLGNQAVSGMMAGMVQRNPEPVKVIGKKATSHPPSRDKDGNLQSPRVVDTGTKYAHKRGEELLVDYDLRALSPGQLKRHKKDPSKAVGKYALIVGNTRYVSIKSLRPQPKGPPSPASPTAGGAFKRAGEALSITSDGAKLSDFERTDQISALSKEIKGLPDGPEKDAKQAEKDQLSNEATTTDLVATSIGAGTQVIALVSSIQKLINAKGGWNRADAAMGLVVNVAKTGSTAATIVDKVGKNIYGAKAGFGGQAAGAADGVEKSTMAAGVLGAIGEILAGVVAAVKRVKAIVDLVRNQKKFGKTLGDKEKGDFALSTVKDATSIAKSAVSATKSIVDVTEAGGASDALKSAVPGLGIAIAAVDIVQRAFHLVVDAMNRARARAAKGVTKAKLAVAMGANAGKLTLKKVKAFMASPAYGTLSKEQKEQFEDYLMDRELQTINEKRMTRQAIKIALDINDIIAEALNLGGVTAAAGLSLKIIGGATKLILPAFRRFKQWGRDKAAAAIAKGGKATGFYSIFNAKKSSKAKGEMREKMINRIFNHMVDWWNMKDDTDDEKELKATQGERVKNLFKAAGMSWTAVEGYTDANELAKDLDAALKKRE